MTVVYNTFADWEDSFFIQDLSAGMSLTPEQKKFSMLGIVIGSRDNVNSIYDIVRMGVEAYVYGVIIDFHMIQQKEKLSKIIELLENFGYMDTESYENRLGYFRNWQFGDFGWVLEKNIYQCGKYRKVCKPLDCDSLAETLSAIPCKSYKEEYEINYENIGKELADLANKEVFKFL